MANLFVLGRLRAACTALENETEQLAKRLTVEKKHGLYVDNLAFLPIENCQHFPSTYQSRLAGIVDNLFDDYVIGRCYGKTLSARGQLFVDVIGNQLFLYGRNSKLWREGSSPKSGKFEKIYEIDAATFRELEARELARVRRRKSGDYDDDDDAGEPGDPREEGYFWPGTYIEGDFRTEGLVGWFRKFDENGSRGPSRANLLILITRDEFEGFYNSRDGQKLKAALGPDAKVVMKSQSAAIIAFELAKSAFFRHETTQLLRPRLIEDFMILDIGLEITPMLQNVSPLADWAAKRIAPAPVPRQVGRRVLKPIEG